MNFMVLGSVISVFRIGIEFEVELEVELKSAF